MFLDRPLEVIRERGRRAPAGLDPMEAARAAIGWLYAAQDANDDGGVSHSYLVGQRWMRSYPETTGYIIPTLLNWSRITGETEAEGRALRMADWELDGQLESGAIPELTGGHPTVFDTGQVIFGWTCAYRHTGDEKYLDAARRGADWLLDELGEDGVWRHSSDSGGPGRVYNARVAWALLELGLRAESTDYEEPMRRFLEWGLKQEKADGWYDRNCLTDDAGPLLHTIAYTMRGQLESALLLGDARFLESSRRTARRLVATVKDNGFMPGRFRPDFSPAVSWSCLTGMAQTSIVWRRLASLEDTSAEEGRRFSEAASKVNGFLIGRQDRSSSHPGMRGGIRGSYPIHGAYGKWRVLNWATKFFVDALLIETDADALDHRG
jgi:hypothetical protein